MAYRILRLENVSERVVDAPSTPSFAVTKESGNRVSGCGARIRGASWRRRRRRGGRTVCAGADERNGGDDGQRRRNEEEDDEGRRERRRQKEWEWEFSTIG